MAGITAALTLPAGGKKETCYLFQGTWTARYEKNGSAWEFKNSFDLPQHLTWYWSGLAGTAGHRPYPAVFASGGEIYFLRPDHLVRYHIAKNEVQSDANAKPENTFDVTELPSDFLAKLSGAMDTPQGIYLFSGLRWALFNLRSGDLKKQGTLGSPLSAGVDAACWPEQATSGYLFSGDAYYTCTAGDDGTLTVAAGGPITDVWKKAPLTRPLADIYASGQEAKRPVLFRTAIDLSTDTLPGRPKITATGTVIKGDDLKTSGDRASWSISGNGRHGFLVNYNKIVAVDLTKITGDNPVIRTESLSNQTLWDCALTRDGGHLWTGGDDSGKWQKMLHQVEVSKIDASDPTVNSYGVSGAVYGLALSHEGDKVYPGVVTENYNVQVVVTNTADGTPITTLSVDTVGGKPLVATSLDGSTVVTSLSNGSVKKFKGLEAPKTFPLTNNLVRGLAVTPDGTRLCAVATEDNYSVAVVDLTKDADNVRRVELPDITMPRRVAIDPNGRFGYVAGYISGDANDSARLWVIDLTTATHVATVEADWGSENTQIDDVEIAWRWE
ncbi:YncE family protein [Streptomyces noursei]|uniref:YncE family protein n=1 Tax=Streptomyces noursei TaxID=1971 RepID=UPI0033D1C657